jgi:hypothetical protein
LLRESIISFWKILGRLAVSSEGETIQRLNDNISVSSEGTIYARMGLIPVGSDGSTFTQIGSFRTDGSIGRGSTDTGLGAVLTSLTIGQNQKPTNWAWIMTHW